MDPSEAQSRLLRELESHQIPLTSDDVSWAFSNTKTAVPVTDWVERYLGKDTLVSLEEAEIYNHLKKTGALSKLQKQHPELHTVRPRFEDELRVETEQLARSTEMLRRQTAQLQRQGAMLRAMKAKAGAEEEGRRRMEERRRMKWAAEMENEQAAIDDLLGILREEVADFKQNTKASSVDLEGVEKMLRSDDRVLGRLGRLADGVIVSGDEGAEGNEVVERVTVLVKKLSMLSAASLKARLDRMFLEIVNPKNNTNSADNPDADAIAELKQDLESLYSEIPSVAQMAAEQEYLRPVIKEVENGKKKASEGLQVGGAYIRDVLMHLQKRNASAAERLKRDLAKARAISQIIATIEQESKSPLNKQAETPLANDDQKADTSSIRPATPVKNPHPFKNMPIFTPPNRRRGGSLGGDARNVEDDLPELRMLTLLGVPVPSTPAPNASSLFASPVKGGPAVSQELTASKYKYLDAHVRQQFEKLQTQEQDLSAEMEIREAISEFWNVARIAQHALVWANVYPPPARKRGVMSFIAEDLMDGLEEVERKVNAVAGRMGGLGRGLEELQRSGGDLHGQGREKKAFVDRWGRH
ncbi:uncharacterized protein H6S33_001532 [Morchella sextelata]|uniref:uncharacterized protein n=1 Tax=Morchella sextelata TaxID=1174677 RepID=UPI001D059A75|nr:uncharacterized protein H6S33_001532 [Morchella sextelata]KAH0608398.1 hypothetical protein H6S33_001532 [Morchella sextelata]